MSYHSEYGKNRRSERRQSARELLGEKCAKCGATENLDFDHIDSNTKEFNISTILAFRWEKLVKELSKCQLLCKPCHVAKTAEWFKGRPAHNRNLAPYIHGTPRTYHELKCHCEPCKLAKRLYRKKLLAYNEVCDF